MPARDHHNSRLRQGHRSLRIGHPEASLRPRSSHTRFRKCTRGALLDRSATQRHSMSHPAPRGLPQPRSTGPARTVACARARGPPALRLVSHASKLPAPAVLDRRTRRQPRLGYASPPCSNPNQPNRNHPNPRAPRNRGEPRGPFLVLNITITL